MGVFQAGLAFAAQNANLLFAGPASGSAAAPAFRALVAADLAAGAFVQAVVGTYATNADLTTTIPHDDTIPQNTEGTQIISVSITPKTTTNTLVAFWLVNCAGALNNVLAAALFLNSTANAQAVASLIDLIGDGECNLVGMTSWVPGATSAQTVNLRVGSNSATMRCNGSTSARLYGGAMKCMLLVVEYAS